jgi:hypothetical protein
LVKGERRMDAKEEGGVIMLSKLRSYAGIAVAMGAVTLASGACSTPTTMMDQWRDPTYAAGPMRNMLIVGGKMEPTNRRTVEDAFVTALAKRGVHATPSYEMFPGALPSKDEARNAVLKQGIDGVLVANERGIKETTTIVPGAYNSGFWGGYYGGWGTYSPGYLQTDAYVKFETSVWDANQGKLVWSAVTETENPTSGKDFLKSLLKSVLPAMTTAGILPPKSGAPENVSSL